MHQASWMSLGIIVTLLACMVQRLAPSMSPTKYASAASCRHKMACPWKCRSYLPTSGAISWPNHEKGHFWIRSSVLFWKWQISWSATVPGQYFRVFLMTPAFRKSFLGAFPPTVGWSFFQAGSSPPDIDGLASTAIWANCQVGDEWGDLPTSSSHSTSTTLLFNFILVQRGFLHWSWGSTGVGDLCGWLWVLPLPSCSPASWHPFHFCRHNFGSHHTGI